MLVMGYFCAGSNAYWEDRHKDMAHIEDRGRCNVPFALEYLDYFGRSIEDAMRKTGVDGFMIDWIRPTKHVKWLDCEKQMWKELLGRAFPGDRSAVGRGHPRVRSPFDGTLLAAHPLGRTVDQAGRGLDQSPVPQKRVPDVGKAAATQGGGLDPQRVAGDRAPRVVAEPCRAEHPHRAKPLRLERPRRVDVAKD